MEDDEDNNEIPMMKRRKLALEDLSGDEDDSGDEYIPGNKLLINNIKFFYIV